MEEDKGGLQYKEDRQHLQGVSPQLAAHADLLLCTAEFSGMMVGFPVHKMVLTAHSPVLSDAIESTLSEGANDGLPRLPLDGDDDLAVRSALACIYHDYVLPSGASSTRRSMPDISLSDAPTHVSHMKLYDKYSMAIVAQTQQHALMKTLRPYMQHGHLTNADTAAIVECASGAQGCNAVPLLALCESIMIRHFSDFTCQYELMTSKLSPACLLSISRGLFKLQGCGAEYYNATKMHKDSPKIISMEVAAVHQIPTDAFRFVE